MFAFILNIILQIQPSDSILIQNEKVYSILTILLIIFLGIIIYLIALNKRIHQLDHKLKEIQQESSYPTE